MAKRPGTALVQYEQQLLEQANVAKATEESVALGQFFQTKNGVLSYNGAPVKDNTMQVIVVDHVLENKMYPLGKKFDPNSPQTPICYAFGRINEDMVPHEKAPQPQHAQCKGCPQNEFGTSDTGQGKACKNVRRLALIPVPEDADQVKDAQVAYLAPPVTSVRGWAGYVQQLANVLKRPPLGVITQVSVVPDQNTQFKVTFKCVEKIEDPAILGALLEKQKEIGANIGFPYPVIDEEEAPAKGRRAAPPARGKSQPARQARKF